MATNEELLTAIDAKLSGLLALAVDTYIRDTGIARPKARSIDKMLADAGIPASTIARLLGKTDRAVHLQLQNEGKKRTKPRKTRGSK